MNKRIITLLLAVLMLVTVLPLTAQAANMTFKDVPEDAWFYADVKNAFEKELINGKNATTFAPYDNLTYAEAVKLAAVMNQSYLTRSITLTTGTPWYQTYVDYCKEQGIDYEEVMRRMKEDILDADIIILEATESNEHVQFEYAKLVLEVLKEGK